MVGMNPVFIADRKRIAKFFLQQFSKINLVCPLFDPIPELQNFLYMLVDLIASRTAIIDNTFFKQRAAHGKCLPTEFRSHDTTLPVEIHIRKVDAGHPFILVHTEDSFIIYGNKSFKLRPELPDIPGQIFQDLDSFGPTDGENDNISQFCTVIPIKIGHIAKTMNQGLTTGNNVSYHQCAVRNHRQLTVFDLQSRNLFLLKYTLTG